MATEIINTDGDNTPNFKTVRISSIDLPPTPTGSPPDAIEGSTRMLDRDDLQQIPSLRQNDKTVLIKSLKSDQPVTGGSVSHLPLPPEQWIHGWFVAVSGPMKGKSFPIRFGNNTVGRSNTSTICLPDDAKISRSQLSVRYMQGKNRYMVSPINSASQITYLPDDEELIFPTAVNEGDTLKLSPETTVRFVPFCDEQYKWDYTDLPPAPDAPAPAPRTPVTIQVDHPPVNPVSLLPPIPQNLGNESKSTIRINTNEIGLAANNQTVNIGTVQLGTDAGVSNAYHPDLNATVRLERVRQNQAQQTAEENRTQIFRPNAGTQKATGHHPAESWEQGWLVAISGPMKGMYFPITVGINQGGRSTECRICLPADKGISGVQFAIRYVKNKKQFFVTCIETASQLTYLNGEEVTGYELIERGDILKVSELTSLRFIPLCNDSFCWDYPDNI